jgi:hypothetical protein
VLEAAIGRHAWRLRDVTAPSTEQLRQILAEDLTDEPAEADKPSPETETETEPTAAAGEPAPQATPDGEPEQGEQA